MPAETGFGSDIDQFDRRILDCLAEDGRMSITDLAKRVGLSNTPCQLRLKRLLAEGYIEGFKAVLSPAKMGLDHVAFAEVKLTNTHEDALRAFNEAGRALVLWTALNSDLAHRSQDAAQAIERDSKRRVMDLCSQHVLDAIDARPAKMGKVR